MGSTRIEEKGISPVMVVIPLGLGLAAVAVVAAIARAALGGEEEEEEVLPPPPPGKATLYGRVTDSATGSSLEGVLLTLDGVQTSTDAGGNFAFADMEPGDYVLSVTKSGYVSVSESVTLPEGTSRLDISMVPVAKDQFYMPPTLQVSESGPVDGEYSVTFSTTITNKGKADGTHQLEWGSNEFVPEYDLQASRIITIKAGERYEWTWTWTEIPYYYRGYFTVQLFGDWETNNAAIGVWQ